MTASPPSAPHRAKPMVVYLAFLMLVFIAPAFAFSGLLIQRNNIAQEEVVETFTVATTRSVVQAVEREIAGMMTSLRVLMSSATLREDDLAAFHARSQAALQGIGTHLIVIDRNLDQLLNTRVPYGTPLPPLADPASAERAFASADAIVSPLIFGSTAQDWVFSVLLRRPEPAQEVVILTQNARNLSNALITRELPEGWHVALVDRTNRVIASSEAAATAIGQPLFIPLQERAGTGARWQEREIEGEAYKTITQRSILTDWYVVAWAPVSMVDGPLRETFFFLVLGGLAIVALAGLAAVIVARQVAGSVSGLAREARRLGAGEATEPTDYPVKELAEVSTALAEASTQRKAAEAEVRFLMRELAHRSKNQLTVISAMAKQTARGADTVDKFVESFQHRLHGLARSTDLLLTHGATGIALYDLFATQIDPFRPEEPGRVEKSGPTVRLNMQSAQVLGMAAHELATNAAKYGAFAAPDGRLSVVWREAGDKLEIAWRETVPGFSPPSERQGFGTVVVQTMVTSALKAEVVRLVHEDGIEWRFSIPFAEIDPDRQPAPIEP